MTTEPVPAIIAIEKGVAKSGSAQMRLLVYTRNRHLAEWRFLLFIRIVNVYPKIWNVTVIGIEHTPFRVVWRNRLFTLGNTLVSVYRIRCFLSTSDSTGKTAGFSPGRETGRRFFCKYTP